MRRERADGVRRARADRRHLTARGAAANTGGKSSVNMQGLDIFNASPASSSYRQSPPTVRPDEPRPHRDAAPQPIKVYPGAAAATRSKSGGQGGGQGMSCESPSGSGELAAKAFVLCEALRQKLQLMLREYARNWSESEHARACLPEIVGDDKSGGTHTFAVK